MKKSEKLDLIRATKIIAIMRAKSSEQLIAAADAIKAGGVRAIEVTMTTPGALGVIEAAKKKYGAEVLFGAGSVLDSETARAAILAGADFIVAPSLDIPVVQLCNRYSIPVMPGCFTPTEIITAWQAGADMVKLFPADFGGAGFLKAVLAPFPQVEIIPVGGVNLRNGSGIYQKRGCGVGGGEQPGGSEAAGQRRFRGADQTGESLYRGGEARLGVSLVRFGM